MVPKTGYKGTMGKKFYLQGIPKITGMNTSQFITKILAYKTKEKENAVMQMVAERLGEEEINSLALYLSKLK